MFRKLSIGNKKEREKNVEKVDNLEIIIRLNLKHKVDNIFWLGARNTGVFLKKKNNKICNFLKVTKFCEGLKVYIFIERNPSLCSLVS